MALSCGPCHLIPPFFELWNTDNEVRLRHRSAISLSAFEKEENNI